MAQGVTLLTWRVHRILHELRHSLIAPSRNPRAAVVVGRLLAIAFLLCFGTGLYSHFLQEPASWMTFLTRPIWLYQVTQGIHITAGIACFPLILAKLYAVFPALFQTPPLRSFAHFLERASIALFVAASLVQISIGLLNTYQFYSLFPFSFRNTHWVLSFVVVGSLAIHIGVKLPIIARYWTKKSAYDSDSGEIVGEPNPDGERDVPDEYRRLTGQPMNAGVTGRVFAWIDREPAPRSPDSRAAISRRGFVGTVAVAAATVVAFTAGQSFRVLDGANLFAPRKNDVGPQGLPVNRTAHAAAVVGAASSPGWTLTVTNGQAARTFDYAQLLALPQYDVHLPIACVEGWSQYANWRGPRLKDLMATVDSPGDARVLITSLQTNSSYGQTTMLPEFVRDDLTLVALKLEGETLDLDHGYPARIIAPTLPGVLQTKWLSELSVLS